MAGKIYVQDLIYGLRSTLAPLILEKRAYVYICGDAKNMAHSVEEQLMIMLGEAKGGSAAVEGAKEFKLLKERSVCCSDHRSRTAANIIMFCSDFFWMYGRSHLLALTGISIIWAESKAIA